MSEGGAESAGEENSDTKADFLKGRGGKKKIHLQTFWQPVPASHSHFLSLSFFKHLFLVFLPSAAAHKTSSRAIGVHPPPPHPPGGRRAAITPVITITISPPVSAQPSRRSPAKTEQSENEVTSLYCSL